MAVRCCAHILPVSEALSLLSNAMATIKDSESSGGSGSNIEAETTAAALMRLRALNAIMASYARRGAVAETDELLATMQAEGMRSFHWSETEAIKRTSQTQSSSYRHALLASVPSCAPCVVTSGALVQPLLPPFFLAAECNAVLGLGG